MSTVGQAAGYIVGGIVGSFVGYPALGAQIGGMIGGYIDPPKGPKIEGPRLSDLTVQTATLGAVIPQVFGTTAVFGNIFWVENNALKETKNTESQGKGGGGQEVTNYTYSATFALGLCKGPIVGIKRIWISGKLVYTNDSTDTASIAAGLQPEINFTLHTGTSTQAANPRMQAALGVANTSAYRGLAYLVFEDLQLADFGNSLMGAQIKVEIVASGSVSSVADPIFNYPRASDELSLGIELHGSVFSSAHPYTDAPGTIGKITNKIVNIDGSLVSSAVIDANSAMFWAGGTTPRYPITGRSDRVVGFGTNPVTGINSEMLFNSSGYPIYNVTGFGTFPYEFRSNIASYGETLYAIKFNTSVTQVQLYKWISGVIQGVTLTGFSTVYDNNQAFIAVSPDGTMLAIDMEMTSAGTGAVKTIIYDVATFSAIYYTNTDLGALIGWNALGLLFRDGGENIRMVNPLGFSTTGYYYGPVGGAANSVFNSTFKENDYVIMYDGVIVLLKTQLASTPVTLESIVNSVCLESNMLDAADIDATDLDDTVYGYKVATVSALRSSLEQLQAAYPFDVVPSGYKIKFKRRGGSSVGTIQETDLAASTGGSQLVRLTESREVDSRLPQRVVINYIDKDAEYDTGTQYAERLVTDSVNVQTLDLPISMSADQAAQAAEVLTYMHWAERYDYSFSLPPSFNAVQPADVLTIARPDATHIVRLGRVESRPDGVIECAAKPCEPSVYVSTAVGVPPNFNPQFVSAKSTTKCVLLDIPLVDEQYDKPGFFVAASGFTENWDGATLYRSTDGEVTWEIVSSIPKPSVIGYATNSITTAQNLTVDTNNLLNVIIPDWQDLTSVSRAQVAAGNNWFAYGRDGNWEIIGAESCVLQGDGSYNLSGLLRNRFCSYGLLNPMLGHKVGDTVVMLDRAALVFIDTPLSLANIPIAYKAVSSGKTLDSAHSFLFAYSAINLKPMSPVYVNGNRHPTTRDWTLIWVRRPRIGGTMRDYYDVPLGETTESYVFEVYSSNTYSVLKRSITVSVSLVTYTSAQQVADFGADQSTLYYRVYQVSATVGRGMAQQGSISRG